MNVLANDYYMRLADFVKSYQAFNLKISIFRFEGSFANEPSSHYFDQVANIIPQEALTIHKLRL